MIVYATRGANDLLRAVARHDPRRAGIGAKRPIDFDSGPGVSMAQCVLPALSCPMRTIHLEPTGAQER